MGYCMLRQYENRNAHYIVPRRKLGARYLGTGKKPSPATGAACSDYSDGCRRYAEPSDRSRSGYQQTNGPALAAAFLGFSPCGAAKGRSTSWSYPQNYSEKNPGCCRSHPAYHPIQYNPLEYPRSVISFLERSQIWLRSTKNKSKYSIPAESDISQVFETDDILTLPVRIATLAKPEITLSHHRIGRGHDLQQISQVSKIKIEDLCSYLQLLEVLNIG